VACVVKTESDPPDLWALAREERAWLTFDEGAFRDNTPFNASEQELIARHLGTLAEYAVKTYNLQAGEAAHVRAQLNDLVEAARRVGRFDWKNLAASTFLSVVVTLGLDFEKTRKLMALATELFGPLGGR
jgi:hypothetical protein